jgi:hypothetical protein
MNAASPNPPQTATSAASVFHSGCTTAPDLSISGHEYSRHIHRVSAVEQEALATSVAAPICRKT